VSSATSASSAFGLDFQSLLSIILTQLTYQDPLKPMDNYQFVSQLGQFAQLQQSQTLNDQITSLLAAQSVLQATGLLGHTVDVTASQSAVSGVVQAVNLSSGAPALTIKTADGQTIANLAIAAGSGVRFNKPSIDYSEGQLQQTGGELDLAIQGSGFLVLQKDGSTYYARTGQFAVGDDGYIALQGTAYRLTVLDANHQPSAVNVDAKRATAPGASTKVVFTDNLSTGSTTATVPNIKVFDGNGGTHTWQVVLTPTGTTAPGEWTVAVTDETGGSVGSGKISFLGGAPDPTKSKVTITSSPANAPPLSVELDFSQGVTSYSSGTSSALRVASSDGKAAGTLTSVTVDDTGQIKLTYSNGATDVAGAVALADFRDPQQLARIGSGLFTDKGHGPMQVVASGQSGVGTLVSKQLEGSNVNLSQEFGNLILIQRGFQASSQVVSVANDMLQQLFGIRGQG
jgi:flagellar hook protein FlgE